MSPRQQQVTRQLLFVTESMIRYHQGRLDGLDGLRDVHERNIAAMQERAVELRAQLEEAA